MEIKKTEKASLENKKLLFLELGLVVSLLITFVAFEWKQEEISVADLEDTTQIEAEEEIIPITQDTPPPPPSEVKIPILSDQIDIVDDNIELESNIINLEDDANLGVEIQDYVEVIEETVKEEDIPFFLAEEKPSFNGGDANTFTKWVNERLVYPELARENGVQGKVVIQFTIEKDGRVNKIKVIRGVDSQLDKEAVRVISMSPKWKPGKMRDETVAVSYVFPVVFQLR